MNWQIILKEKGTKYQAYFNLFPFLHILANLLVRFCFVFVFSSFLVVLSGVVAHQQAILPLLEI